jgi:hypothetical protein
MKQNEIIEMARQADPFGEHGRLYVMAQLTPETIEAFAKLVAEREREACAKLCDELAELNRFSETDSMWEWAECSAAIRARGNV